MTTDDIYVPLKLIECEGGSLRGKVRLQKLAFLVQAECGTVDYGFQAAPLGPLSYPLNATMSRLQDLGMVDETREPTPSGNTVFCYALTERGKSLLRAMDGENQAGRDLEDAVRSTYDRYGGMSYIELLDLVHQEHPRYHLKDIPIGDFLGGRGA